MLQNKPAAKPKTTSVKHKATKTATAKAVTTKATTTKSRTPAAKPVAAKKATTTRTAPAKKTPAPKKVLAGKAKALTTKKSTATSKRGAAKKVGLCAVQKFSFTKQVRMSGRHRCHCFCQSQTCSEEGSSQEDNGQTCSKGFISEEEGKMLGFTPVVIFDWPFFVAHKKVLKALWSVVIFIISFPLLQPEGFSFLFSTSVCCLTYSFISLFVRNLVHV